MKSNQIYLLSPKYIPFDVTANIRFYQYNPLHLSMSIIYLILFILFIKRPILI